MIYSYTSHAKNYYETNYIADKDLLPLATALTELFMNIADHSSSLISGFCITQFYPNTGKLKFSVCDFGIGIPSSINRFLTNKGQNPLPHNSCMDKAFELFTTQSLPRNRGFGLDTIKTIIQSNLGELRVVSNNGLYKVNGAFTKSEVVAQHFAGTHFEVVLDVNNLKPKNLDTEDFDFQ